MELPVTQIECFKQIFCEMNVGGPLYPIFLRNILNSNHWKGKKPGVAWNYNSQNRFVI